MRTKEKGKRQILVAAAMEEEIAPFTTGEEIESEFISFSINPLHIGVGKVNAAIGTMGYLHKHMMDLPISRLGRRRSKPEIALGVLVGTCGAIDPSLKIGDVVIASDIIQHDVDVTALGFERSEIPFAEKSVWTASRIWTSRAKDAALRLDLTPSLGRLLSGDQFIASKKAAKALHKELEGIAAEFEAASFAQACEAFQLPWLVVKVVSDTANRNASHDFDEFTELAAERCYEVIRDLISSI